MTEAAANIRRLFLDPKDTYSPAEAAEILGMEPLDLNTLTESGELEGIRTCCGMKVSRKELISFALDHWPQASIEETLGDDLAKAIPNSSASPTCTCASRASRSSHCIASPNATASPSTPSSPASCSTLSPPNPNTSRQRSPASPPRFAGHSSVSRACLTPAFWIGNPQKRSVIRRDMHVFWRQPKA